MADSVGKCFSEPALRRSGCVSILSTRVCCAVVGVGLLGLLGTAAILKPDVRGHGTHEQLGLGPCSFATLTGIRCPSCGMTTAWSCLMHGQLQSAFQTHVGGTLLGVVAIVVSAVTLVRSIGNHTDRWMPTQRMIMACVAGAIVGILVEWILRLAIQGIGLPD